MRNLGWLLTASALCLSHPLAAQNAPLVIGKGRLGPIALCSRLDVVNKVFRHVKDTVLTGEVSTMWRAKLVNFGDGRLTFASSWSDSSHIWTMGSTSSRVKSPRGYRVGMRFSELIAAREPMTLAMPEGGLVINLDSEGVGVAVDEGSERRFYDNYQDYHNPPRLEMVPDSARVTELFVSGGCPKARFTPKD
jgi:hypothetical protein